MRCPFCSFLDTQVKDSRPSDDHLSIRRRRFCPECGSRFTTFERVQLCEVVVIKRKGDRAPFERDKLARSIYMAVRKRPMNTEQVERLINGLVRKIETKGDTEISSKEIGEMVLESLQSLDPVAYIRFASVYKEFTKAEDFENLIRTLKEGNALLDKTSQKDSPPHDPN